MPFYLATCQAGLESVLKREIQARVPELLPSFSRPGFVTFKTQTERAIADVVRPVFTQSWSQFLGKLDFKGEVNLEDAAQKILATLPGDSKFRLHVWERAEDASGEMANQLRAVLMKTGRFEAEPRAHAGDSVLEAIWVEKNSLWWGTRTQNESDYPLPGGKFGIELPSEAPSRAWLKIEEALAWLDLEPQRDEIAVEIGSAPGGATYALLNRGVKVIGIDPGDMDPVLMEKFGSDRFQHFRAGVASVRREALPERVDWLLLDMNVAPQVSLYQALRLGKLMMKDGLKGVFLTVKLNDEETLIPEISSMIEQVKALKFSKVRARQLPANRREFLIAAITRQGKTAPSSAKRRRIVASRPR